MVKAKHIIAGMVLGLTVAVQASVIFEAEQVGDDIVISSSGGSLNLSGCTPGTKNLNLTGAARIKVSEDGGNNAIYLGTGYGDIYDITIENPTLTGLLIEAYADSATGSFYGIYPGSDRIFVPAGYESGAELPASSATYNATTLASWGLSGGDSFTWTWGSGGTADSATFNVVPEPPPLRLWASSVPAHWRFAASL